MRVHGKGNLGAKPRAEVIADILSSIKERRRMMRHALSCALLALSVTISDAAELHPIVEVETGYFFGATENGKWITAEKAAKRVPAETTYRVYGLTAK